jgi:enoyl-CoA hydratase/carnithine racemase
MTGSQVNATDALELGIGTHVVGHDEREAFLKGLEQLNWQAGSPQGNRAVLAEYLAVEAYTGDMPVSDVAVVDVESIDLSSLSSCYGSIQELEGTSKWVDKGVATLRKGCPTTAGIIFKQLSLGPSLSLAECFMAELAVATNCLSRPDFAEGVRALLIDKDQSPIWTVASVKDVSQSIVDEHFIGQWEREGRTHPLVDLQ